MVRNRKSWLAAASILLLVGAGCADSAKLQLSTDDAVDIEAEGSMDVGKDSKAKSESGAEIDIDAAVDAALRESDDSAKEETEENSDDKVLKNDTNELNDYGNAYDKNEL